MKKLWVDWNLTGIGNTVVLDGYGLGSFYKADYNVTTIVFLEDELRLETNVRQKNFIGFARRKLSQMLD